ncbi:hypothetical protein C1884_14130 [Pseudomonas sp. GW460-R15]|nr:hypothetical protein C1887_17320 [Pseudomonas sp. GW456-R21]POA66665.1 hypothetical protein C1884_14130 [Pseudomonas sp. GW460-R15]
MSNGGKNDFLAQESDSTEPALMSWSINVQTRPTGAWDITMALLVLFGVISLTYGLYEEHFSAPGGEAKSVLFSTGFGAAWLFITGYLWTMVVHRKITYHYSIHTGNGWCLQHLAVPNHAGRILELLQIGVPLLSFVLILDNPPLTWLLALPVAVTLIGPRSWLGLDLNTRSKISAPWSTCQRVLIDRQNNRVIAYQADRNDMFEVYLPEHLLESYLKTLSSLLPSNALFEQAH